MQVSKISTSQNCNVELLQVIEIRIATEMINNKKIVMVMLWVWFVVDQVYSVQVLLY